MSSPERSEEDTAFWWEIAVHEALSGNLRPALNMLLSGHVPPPRERAALEGLPTGRGRRKNYAGVWHRLKKGIQLRDRLEAIRHYDSIVRHWRNSGERLRDRRPEALRLAVKRVRDLGGKVTEEQLASDLKNRGRR